jgi:hypothetical protein
MQSGPGRECSQLPSSAGWLAATRDAYVATRIAHPSRAQLIRNASTAVVPAPALIVAIVCARSNTTHSAGSPSQTRPRMAVDPMSSRRNRLLANAYVPGLRSGQVDPKAQPEVVRETAATALVDAQMPRCQRGIWRRRARSNSNGVLPTLSSTLRRWPVSGLTRLNGGFVRRQAWL